MRLKILRENTIQILMNALPLEERRRKLSIRRKTEILGGTKNSNSCAWNRLLMIKFMWRFLVRHQVLASTPRNLLDMSALALEMLLTTRESMSDIILSTPKMVGFKLSSSGALSNPFVWN